METILKKILIIDLKARTSEVKSFADLRNYIGGFGLGIKLLETFADTDPIIFSVGPLTGFFPFAAKTSVVLFNDGVVEDLYFGGNLASRIKFTGVDAIVIANQAYEPQVLEIFNTKVDFRSEDTDVFSLGLPGKRSSITADKEKVLLGEYFITPEDFLAKKFLEKNIRGISLTGTENYKVKNFSGYQALYKNILGRLPELRVEKGIYPSCSGCPMGCGKSKFGEIGGNVLIHSLVACHFADKIYSDIGMVFSCLNILGYDYTHEDIERLPHSIEETLKRLTH